MLLRGGYWLNGLETNFLEKWSMGLYKIGEMLVLKEVDAVVGTNVIQFWYYKSYWIYKMGNLGK
ncbi:hypothetical protein Hanom_Chr07g00588541 [Helianthus anomalus]